MSLINNSLIREKIYYVKGMHCASCEVLIEKKLLKQEGIKSVEASTAKRQVVIEYQAKGPSIEELNNMFKTEGYVFANKPFPNKDESTDGNVKKDDFLSIISAAVLLIVGFLILKKLGIANLVSINAKSSLIMLFAFGLMAGLSSCAALVGGLVLSMSKQWSEMYDKTASLGKKMQPHLMFNIGRLVSYTVLGAILGLIGSKFHLSLTVNSILIFGVSIMMVFLALQMLGVKALRRFQFTAPKFLTRYVADERNFKGRYMPFVMGALTFFLPCGFTITVQGLALISGSPIQAALIMFIFALGTLPMLMVIGFSSIKFSQRPSLSVKFLKIAGVLVLFFALFNINNQLTVLGYSSLGDIFSRAGSIFKTQGAITNDIQNAPLNLVDGKQVIKMNASASGYSPNYFKVKAGVPVKWEITDTGTSGCTNAVISKSLFDGSISLTPGQVSVKEFTPIKTGKYKFSCWMGMVSGVIEVVNSSVSSGVTPSDTAVAGSAGDAGSDGIIPSGAAGCGCGGGGNR